MHGRFLLNIFAGSKWAKVKINLDRGPSDPNIKVDLACYKRGDCAHSGVMARLSLLRLTAPVSFKVVI